MLHHIIPPWWSRKPLPLSPACRSLLQLELEAEGCSAALRTLSSLCAELSAARGQRRTALQQLRLKHARIQEFAKGAVSSECTEVVNNTSLCKHFLV